MTEKRFMVVKTYYPNEDNPKPKKIRYMVGHNKGWWDGYNDLLVWKWGYKSKETAVKVLNEEISLRKWECDRKHSWSIKVEVEEYPLDPNRDYEGEYRDYKRQWAIDDFYKTTGILLEK